MSSLNKGLVFHAPLNSKSEKTFGYSSFTQASSQYIALTAIQRTITTSTFTFWIKTTSTDASSGYAGNPALTVLGDSSGSTVSFGMGVHDGKIRVTRYSGGWNNLDSSSSVNDGNWHHIAIAFSSGTCYIYIDGVLDNSGSLVNSTTIYIRDIGRGYNGDYFDGDITDVRYYNTNLNASSIQTLAKGENINKSVVQTNLINWWKLDGDYDDIVGSGDGTNNGSVLTNAVINDITPYNNNGTVYGATQNSGDMSFDGTDDKIVLPGNTDVQFQENNDFTISTWVKTSVSDSVRYIISFKNGGSTAGWAIMIKSGGNVRSNFGDGTDTRQITSTAIDDGEWHNVILRNSNGENELFIDNVSGGTNSTALSTISYSGIAQCISSGNASNNNIWSGNIKDCRIYNRALTDVEIKNLYDLGGRQNNISTSSLYKGLVLDMPLKSKNEKVGSELITNQVDRDFSGVSNWSNNNITSYDETGDLTLTATVQDQYAYLNIGFAPTTVGKTYRLSFDTSERSGSAKYQVRNFANNQTIVEATIDGHYETDFIAVATGGFRIVSTAYLGTITFDNFSLKEIKTADNTPNANHGTIYGATVGTDSTSFDGTNDYIDLPIIYSGAESRTVSMWINKASAPATEEIAYLTIKQ